MQITLNPGAGYYTSVRALSPAKNIPLARDGPNRLPEYLMIPVLDSIDMADVPIRRRVPGSRVLSFVAMVRLASDAGWYVDASDGARSRSRVENNAQYWDAVRTSVAEIWKKHGWDSVGSIVLMLCVAVSNAGDRGES